MDINWGEALEGAENSPRGLLSELLARADEIDDIVIVFTTRDGEAELTNTWQNTRHQSMTISLLEYAKWHQLHMMYEASQL